MAHNQSRLGHRKEGSRNQPGVELFLNNWSYCLVKRTASAITKKPAVVQQLRRTVLLPALKLKFPRLCQVPPLTC
jgi:hypothetical protein